MKENFEVKIRHSGVRRSLVIFCWIPAFAGMTLFSATASALGLRTHFAEVSVKDLKIGKTYSLADLVNLPLRVTNTDSQPVDLSVSVLKPAPSELQHGFESIPDTSWIHLEKTDFRIPANADAVSDVVISVPNDPALLGRRFQVFLWTQAGKGNIGVGLKSRILLAVSSLRPTDIELKEQFKPRQIANLNFSFNPMEVAVGPVKLGQSFPIMADKNPIVLVNPNPAKYTFRLTPVAMWETDFVPPAGSDAAPDPNWLKVKQPIMKMKAFAINPIDLSVQIPNDPAYLGKRYTFVLRGEILEQAISAYSYLQIYVETPPVPKPSETGVSHP